jgi:uncharacterized protein YcfJ
MRSNRRAYPAHRSTKRSEDTMKKSAISVAVLLTLAGTGVAAPDFTDTAQVISSTPIIERITEQRQDCAPDPSGAPAPAPERSMAGPIVGGVAGAILGHQVGRGSGRTAATAAGAAVGTIVGDRVANPDSNRPVTGAVVGGAAGGLIGAQVGRGSGRDAAAAAGAIGGAVVGDRVQNPQTTASAQPAQRCRTVETTRDVVKGYTVVYRYNGRDIATTLPHDPGRTVRVGVSVLDAGPPASAPTAGMMGSNVREVTQTPASPEPRTTPATGSGGYNYRY